MSAHPAAGSTPRILLVYATKHGHTAKIAAHVADGIREAGGEVDVRELANDVSPSGYAAAVVGASIHAGHHQREMVDWVSHDYDYTDWDAASRFGGEVAAMITVAGTRR
jgi:menaquinone-dependent protoporphyrinogen IX oxidase